MATFGVEAIRHFGNARANNISTAADPGPRQDRSMLSACSGK